MSTCINELHLQQPPFTIARALDCWQATCVCGKRSAGYVLISGALTEQSQHADSHRLCVA